MDGPRDECKLLVLSRQFRKFGMKSILFTRVGDNVGPTSPGDDLGMGLVGALSRIGVRAAPMLVGAPLSIKSRGTERLLWWSAGLGLLRAGSLHTTTHGGHRPTDRGISPS